MKRIYEVLLEKCVELSMQRFSANVIEKCIQVSDEKTQAKFIQLFFDKNNLVSLLKNKFGSHLLTKVIKQDNQVSRGKHMEAICEELARKEMEKFKVKWIDLLKKQYPELYVGLRSKVLGHSSGSGETPSGSYETSSSKSRDILSKTSSISIVDNLSNGKLTNSLASLY